MTRVTLYSSVPELDGIPESASFPLCSTGQSERGAFTEPFQQLGRTHFTFDLFNLTIGQNSAQKGLLNRHPGARPGGPERGVGQAGPEECERGARAAGGEDSQVRKEDHDTIYCQIKIRVEYSIEESPLCGDVKPVHDIYNSGGEFY